MVAVNPLAITQAMFVNSFATNAVISPQTHSWWHEEISRINPAQRNSDPVHVHISVLNKSFQHCIHR
jgi:hypothetical protein